MVALKSAQITQFLKSPDKNIRAVLVYGPDHGLVKERVDRLITDFIGSKDDPFNLSILEDSALKDDPTKLMDEAHAGSLMGGNRAILANDAGDGLHKSLGTYMNTPNETCLIVARAGDLKPNNKLRGFFDKSKNAASLPCYSGDTRSIGDLINSTCAEFKLSIDPDAKRALMDVIGSDFAISKSEIEKLCTYCLKNGTITNKDIEAVCGENGLITLDTLTDSLLTGDLALFERAFQKATHSGQNPSTIIYSITRHLQKLHAVALNIESGLNNAEAIKRIRPPVHFKRKDSINRQARIWRSKDILSALSDLQICEKETRKKPALSGSIAHRALLKMGYIARAKNS